MSNTEYTRKQPDEHRLMPNMLRALDGNRALADQIIAEVEDSLWLAEAITNEKATAWDEGYTRGFYDRELMHGEVRDASEGPSVNPYEAQRLDPGVQLLRSIFGVDPETKVQP